ncbi:MAG: helix-turn-helix domain-containing protein [Bacteroidales bacterium]|nr:helix-turn-helix domain-containing protein [Candidatus Sodaliphilus aphodohippi]
MLSKERLTEEESMHCSASLYYMGLLYMNYYYNYQLGAKYFLKSKQIAQKYDLKAQYAVAVDFLAILNATRNNLEKNYAYSPELMGYFKGSFKVLSDYLSSVKSPKYDESSEFNACMGNMVYLAIKYDRVDEVMDEIKVFRSIKTRHTFNTTYDHTFCKIADCWQNGQYEQALELLEPSVLDYHEMYKSDSITHKQVAEILKYYILMKSNRVKDAENQLLMLEKESKRVNMTFELLEVLNMLQLHYDQQGNEALARKYELQYYTTKDEFIAKSMLNKIDEAALDLRLEESNEQMNEMKYEQRIHKIMLWGLSVFALMALIILAIVFANNRKIRKKNEILYKRTIELLQTQPVEQPEPEAARPLQDEPSQNALLERICKVMETSPEVYGESFTINRLAELVDSNRNYVSQVINDRKQCNFNAMLNDYRIKEACRRLLDTEHYGGYTIEGIARSVGFKSRTNFAAVFKDITGLTPSAFQKMSGQQ